jgi:flagellar protein FlbD
VIRLTKLDGARVVVNCDLILLVERTPDTLLLLAGGTRLLVKEEVDEVVARAVEYRRQVLAGPIVAAPAVESEQR